LKEPFVESEKSLIQRAQKGNQDAFAALVDEHQRFVYNLALRVVKDENEALDLTQETFCAPGRLFNFRDSLSRGCIASLQTRTTALPPAPLSPMILATCDGRHP
jgi:hypothetical protein